MITIQNATIINRGEERRGSVVIEGETIKDVSFGYTAPNAPGAEVIDAEGLLLCPGVIDDQVHFREPGLTHKADIASESRAAVAGGVTSYMEMPNTKPPTTDAETLQWKYNRAAECSAANYAFFAGATNQNIEFLKTVDYSRVPGIKLFMGSSTGNMLVDNAETLNELFSHFGNSGVIIAAHCEDEQTIRSNTETFKLKYLSQNNAASPSPNHTESQIPWEVHPLIRSAEACFKCSQKAAELARRHGTRLHILHISTAAELNLLDSGDLGGRLVTGEACVHHLWFADDDYAALGPKIKWNPAVKTPADRKAIRTAVASGLIPVVATDHAPHTRQEKGIEDGKQFRGSYLTTPSGGPLVQHSLIAMLTLADEGAFSRAQVIERMCHAPADLFGVEGRGYIEPGRKADIVLVERRPFSVTASNIFSKCGWSPFEGQTFNYTVKQTFVNGKTAYKDGIIINGAKGESLRFKRV